LKSIKLEHPLALLDRNWNIYWQWSDWILKSIKLEHPLALLDRNWNIYWQWSDWILKALNLSILWLTITILKCSFLKISLALLDRN
jgi:hypothetical protein